MSSGEAETTSVPYIAPLPSCVASFMRCDGLRVLAAPPWQTAGKGGAFFFFTQDRRFMLKTVSATEMKTLQMMVNKPKEDVQPLRSRGKDEMYNYHEARLPLRLCQLPPFCARRLVSLCEWPSSSRSSSRSLRPRASASLLHITTRALSTLAGTCCLRALVRGCGDADGTALRISPRTLATRTGTTTSCRTRSTSRNTATLPS